MAEKSPKEPGLRNPSARGLGLLSALGVSAALWALFLWTELWSARSGGGSAFCAFGTSDCGLLWDASFASTVHRLTGLPVAAWGLVWGVVAFLLPLLALVSLAEGRGIKRALGAVTWTAAAGLLSLGALLGASASAGLFCTSCALTYVLTLAYFGVTFFVLKPKGKLHLPGLGLAAASTLGVFLLLLYPGLRTPKSKAQEERTVLRQAVERQSEESGSPAGPPAGREPGGDRAPHAGQLEEFLANLEPQVRQYLSDSLGHFKEGTYHEEPPRTLEGSPEAPVRITDFTDALCSHCATLFGTITYLKNVMPPDSFSVDSRHFPLDGNCNARLPIRGPESVRCLAARAQICFENTPHISEFSGAIFRRQQDLTPELVFELAAPYMARPALEACLASADTAEKLAADVEYAGYFNPRGTPIVLINGREASAYGPFLYAMVLAGGDADHPAFASLPAPDPSAHVH